MYEILLPLHSYWAILVCLLVTVFLVAVIYHFATKNPVSPALRKVAFYATMAIHLQFIVGIILYLVSPTIDAAWESGQMMSDPGFRLLGIEHPLMMFTAVILITIANVKVKRNEFVKASTLIFLLLASACFYMIPWSNWFLHN